MSNFQRTRSKVWWGDSPPNLGSPLPHASNREGYRAGARPDDDWEPQLPAWIPEESPIQELEESPPLPAINPWSRRHSSPGSHKSQDSGFSDSDSSPANQQNGSKEKSKAEAKQADDEKKECNGVDENDNKCCHNEEINEFKTPAKKELSNNVVNYLQTPKSTSKSHEDTPIRNLIKTPKGLQDYLQAHCDVGHKSFDSINIDNCSKKSIGNSIVKVVVTPQRNINGNVAEKSTTKRNLVDVFNNYEQDAKKSIDNNVSSGNNIEYIQVSPLHQIAVNNQPRMRSPITRVAYHPPVHYASRENSPRISNASSSPKFFPNPQTAQIEANKDDDYGFRPNEIFQRNGMNRSFNYSSQKIGDQILDDGPHSLGYIEVMQQNEMPNFKGNKNNTSKEDINGKAFTSRKLTDSLNLKTPKKSISRTKQKIQAKSKQSPKINKSFFNFLPKKNDTIKTIYDITRGHPEVDRVPALGLPENHSKHDWDVSNSSSEKMSECHDRSVDDNNLNHSNSTKAKSPKSILKTPGTNRKITPPLQFQDGQFILREKTISEFNSIYIRSTSVVNSNKPARNFVRQTSNEDIHFCEMELSSACTSTPKTLLPQDYLASSLRGSRAINRPISKIRPINLLSNFNESVKNESGEVLNASSPTTPVEKLCENQPAPVQHWLCELIGLYEPECMTTLQSKALGAELNAKVAHSSATITGNIRKVQTHGQIIAHQYKQLIKELQRSNIFFVQQCQTEITTLIANINEFILAHSITLKIKPPGESPERWDKIKVALQNNIQKVQEVTEDVKVELNETRPEMEVLMKHLKSLLDIFVETARAVLIQQMRTLVSMLEEPPSDMILKSTLTSLGHLGALMSPDGDMSLTGMEDCMQYITELPFVECGVPRALLSVIIESNKSSIKALSLRALATICVTSEAVEQYEEAGGIEIVSDILNEESNPEPQMREAVTVLTQVTAPWLLGDYKLKQLDKFLDAIIKNITGILTRTSCCQLLLLCTACLVNIIHVVKQKERLMMKNKEIPENHPDIMEMLKRHKTVEQLLESVKKRGPSASVFLQEQTATLINSVSCSSRGRSLLIGCPAAPVALVCFLRIPRSSPARPAKLQAEFRLVNQAAEALARLCTIPEVVSQIVQLEGPSRLVRVVKAQKPLKMEGKCSDQILANCLRALRAVVKINKDCLQDLDCDVTDMIKPSLMESVKLYSAKQESYV